MRRRQPIIELAPTSCTEDPAVVAWRMALAPQQRPEPVGRHWWRELVTDAHRSARDAWLALRESSTPAYAAAGAANSGAACYQLSDEEFAQLFPPPTLTDAMRALSGQRLDPYSWGPR